MLGIGEILIFGGVLVLIFGATQIPKIARSLGEGLKEFKKSVKEAKEFDADEPDGNEPEGKETGEKKSGKETS
jgi:sec-independent protein translocase protein TatA